MVLLQEEFGRNNPWRILVICILLNRTQGQQARPVLKEFFYRWPGPRALAGADIEDIEKVIAPLGLIKRAGYLKKMTAQYLVKRPDLDVTGYAGCGLYAQEAYDMLILGRRWRWPMDIKLCERMREMLSR